MAGGQYTAADLTPADATGGYQMGSADDPEDVFGGELTGVSIDAMLRRLNVSPDNIGTAELSGGSGPFCSQKMSSAFHDFGDPTRDASFPFVNALPPVFAERFGGLVFAVPIRQDGRGDATVSDGEWCAATGTTTMTLTVHLTSTLLAPQLTTPAAPISVEKGAAVTFVATVQEIDPANILTWTWHFDGDNTVTTTTLAGLPGARTSSTPYTFASPGTWFPYVTVTSSNASASGSSHTVQIVVTDPGGTSVPPTDTPAPGESHGNGDTAAPEQGPATGNGTRVGGAATDRPGGGSAGATFGPRSAAQASSGTGDAPAEDDVVVGYLLSDGTGGAEPGAEAGAKPLDDSAPAARNGVTSFRLGGWLLTAAVVIALLAAGAGSERRRPRRAGRRR